MSINTQSVVKTQGGKKIVIKKKTIIEEVKPQNTMKGQSYGEKYGYTKEEEIAGGYFKAGETCSKCNKTFSKKMPKIRHTKSGACEKYQDGSLFKKNRQGGCYSKAISKEVQKGKYNKSATLMVKALIKMRNNDWDYTSVKMADKLGKMLLETGADNVTVIKHRQKIIRTNEYYDFGSRFEELGLKMRNLQNTSECLRESCAGQGYDINNEYVPFEGDSTGDYWEQVDAGLLTDKYDDYSEKRPGQVTESVPNIIRNFYRNYEYYHSDSAITVLNQEGVEDTEELW